MKAKVYDICMCTVCTVVNQSMNPDYLIILPSIIRNVPLAKPQ